MNFGTFAKRSLITASIAAALALQTNDSKAVVKTWLGTGASPGDDITVAANWSGGTLPVSADTPDFNVNSGVNHTITVGAGTAAGRDWHFNSLGGPETWVVNGTGTLLIGRTDSTTANNTGTLLTDAVAGDGAAHLVVNANVRFVGTGAATLQIGGPAAVGGDMEITTPLDAANATTSGMTFNTGSLATNYIKLSGGIKSTNPRHATTIGTGQVILGSSGTWARNFTLGTTGNVATGNIIVTAADSLGAVGTTSLGYTDILSSNGGLVFDNAAGMTVGEFVWTRGRTSTTAPQISNKSGNNIFSGTLSTEKSGLGNNVVVESQAGGTLTFSPTSVINNFNDNTAAVYTLNLIGAGNGEIQGAITEQTNRPWIVAKNGGGTWTISSGQTYTGDTVVSQGTLALTGGGAIANSAAIDVRFGATFDVAGIGGLTLGANQALKGAGTVTGAVNSGSGNTIAAGDSGTGTLTISSALSLSGGTLQFDLSNTPGGSNDKIAVGGNLNLSNSTIVNVNPLNGGLGNGTYNLMTYAGALTGSALSNLTLTGVPSSPRQTFDLTSATPNQINLVVTGSAANLSWVGGVNGDIWVDGNAEPNSVNWTGHPTNNHFYNGDSVTFGTAGTSTVNVSGSVTAGNLTFNNASGKNYSIGGGNVTSGSGTFSNGGNVSFTSGNLTLNGNATFGNAGTINFANGDITLAGTTTFNNSGNVTFANGNLSFNSLTVNATGTGKVTVANTGTLALPAAVAVNSGTLTLNRAGNVTYSANFSGAGTIEQVVANANTVTLTGDNSGFTGQLKLSDGTLKAGSTTALGANSATTFIPNGATLDLNGVILATGTVNLIGTGIGGNGALTSSSTTIDANIPNVVLSGDATIGSNATRGYNIGAARGTAVGGTGSFVGNNHSLTVLANQEIDIKNVGDMGITNMIVTGTKPLYFAGNTSVTGAGEVQLNDGSQIGFYGNDFANNLNSSTGTFSKTIRVMTSANGAGFEMYRGNKTIDSAIVLDGNLNIVEYHRETTDNTNITTTLTGPISGGGNLAVVLNSNSASVSRTGAVILTSDSNSYLGTTKIGGGGGFTNAGPANDRITLSIGNGGATGSVGLGAITVSGGSGVGTARLMFNRNNALSIGNDIHGAGNVEQAGTGTTTLSGTLLDYTGNTTVTAGTLNITGNHTTGANYSVASGASLSTKNVRVTNGLTVNGTATINANGGTAGASKVETLTIGAGGKLNLKDNDLVVGTAPNFDAVRTAIIAGKTNNAAAGITSDITGFGVSRGFGYAMGNDPKVSSLLAGSLAGQAFDTDSVLVKYTLLGDADLDGDTDLNDLGLWSSGYTGDLGVTTSPTTFWTNGDFDYDGDTDLNDLGLWSSTYTGDFNGGSGSLVVSAPGASPEAVAILNGMGFTVVPEPSTFVLAGVGLAGLAIASRRRKK